MISREHVLEWAKVVPWREMWQVEQDLIITHALLKLYENPLLKKSLAFRGGTALNKLFFKPPSRYSEDIDLVQTTSEPIGPTIDAVRSALDPWLGVPKRGFSEGVIALVYRTMSSDGFPLRLKIEINSREHFSVLGLCDYSFASYVPGISGNVEIRSYKLEELLGTKMRALYQRRKGRDLYDLHIALTTVPQLDIHSILQCFSDYIAFSGNRISRVDFLENLELKLLKREFREDMIPLLPKSMEPFDPESAYLCVRDNLINHL